MSDQCQSTKKRGVFPDLIQCSREAGHPGGHLCAPTSTAWPNTEEN